MRKAVFTPGYFAPIDQFCAFVHAQQVIWETEGNYQKQTYRNRQRIYGANGLLQLIIPIIHKQNGKGKLPYKDVKIEYKENWQKVHWKSIESAYRTSPFFEFYEDTFVKVYQKPVVFLLDFNWRCWEAITDCLALAMPQQKTNQFIKKYPETTFIDYRELSTAKRLPQLDLPTYAQVFMEKHGYLPNLSILDLLFNRGPQTISFLQKIPTPHNQTE